MEISQPNLIPNLKTSNRFTGLETTQPVEQSTLPQLNVVMEEDGQKTCSMPNLRKSQGQQIPDPEKQMTDTFNSCLQIPGPQKQMTDTLSSCYQIPGRQEQMTDTFNSCYQIPGQQEEMTDTRRQPGSTGSEPEEMKNGRLTFRRLGSSQNIKNCRSLELQDSQIKLENSFFKLKNKQHRYSGSFEPLGQPHTSNHQAEQLTQIDSWQKQILNHSYQQRSQQLDSIGSPDLLVYEETAV